MLPVLVTEVLKEWLPVPLREGAPLRDTEEDTLRELVLLGCALSVADKHRDAVGEVDGEDRGERLEPGVPDSTALADLDREGEVEALGERLEVTVVEGLGEAFTLEEPPPTLAGVEDTQGDTLLDCDGEVEWEALAVVVMDPVKPPEGLWVREGCRDWEELVEGELEVERVEDTLELPDTVGLMEAHMERAEEALKLEVGHPECEVEEDWEEVELKHRVGEEVGVRLGDSVVLELREGVRDAVGLLDWEGEGV